VGTHLVGGVIARDDPAGDVPAERGRQRRADLPGAGLPAHGVEAAGRGADEDFTGGGSGCGNLAEGQDVGTAVAADLDSAHGQEELARGP
jgi:hypothetical protein